MDQNEKRIIENLFNRLHQAEAQSGPRETEAEALIRAAIARQPAAPYYMAQAIVVQEQALQNLNNRVQELERELAQRPAGGGFLAGLFGGGHPGEAGHPASSSQPTPDTARLASQTRGSGFLGGAVQTAAAVAGGMLLANAIGGLFADEAEAAEVRRAESPDTDNDPAEDDFGGDDFDGGDF